MSNKALQTGKKNEQDFFNFYSREVEVIGFKQSWVTEIKNEMEVVYEKKDKEDSSKSDKKK